MSEGLGKELRNSFFAGLLVVAPLAVSVWILIGVFNWVTDLLLPPSLRDHPLALVFRLVALGAVLVVVMAVGWVTRLVVGKQAVAAVEKIVLRVPLLNRVYGFMKEIGDTLLGSKKTMFQRVVLVPHPRPGMFAIGLVTSEVAGEASGKTNSALIHVFVPASPPMHGFLLLVPREQVIDLEMSVAEGMKLLLSGGAVVPPHAPKANGGDSQARLSVMDFQRAEAIVLRRQPVTESSLIVTWFTRELGKLKTMAKGARRAKGPFVGKIDLFYEDEILFLPSRQSDLHLLHDCFLVQPHKKLRESVPAMTAASYVCELVELATAAEDPHPRVYELLTTLLAALEEKPSGTLLVWFELQLLAALGWTPQWEKQNATGKLLSSLATASFAGVKRIRLSTAQLRDAREAVWPFADEQIGKAPRARRLLLETIS